MKHQALFEFDPAEIDEMPNNQYLGKCSLCQTPTYLWSTTEEWDGYYSFCCNKKVILEAR